MGILRESVGLLILISLLSVTSVVRATQASCEEGQPEIDYAVTVKIWLEESDLVAIASVGSLDEDGTAEFTLHEILKGNAGELLVLKAHHLPDPTAQGRVVLFARKTSEEKFQRIPADRCRKLNSEEVMRVLRRQIK